MRNCNNCDYGSYGLDCETGVETLYCRESEYEHEVNPNDICDEHQFIDGLSNEKNYVLYDESYFGKGYFIIHTINGNIDKFLKIYITNDIGFPNYGIRAFSVNGKDKPEEEFNKIEFIFRSNEDFNNGLFEAFSKFSNNASKEIHTIDKIEQGRNNISVIANKHIVKITFSKDIYHGKQHSTDFIDINLGDNYSCENYEAIYALYNTLMKLCHQTATKEDIKKILTLKAK
ncbi:MAG: hypothetical protein E7163_04535 [Firmicutes bacterium]|nr:hypothetical protein [Bacillota bacterium]